MIWQRSNLAHIAFTISGLTALLGIAVAISGVIRIFESTPAIGILVDQQGNPLPVEGYPQCLAGLAFALTSMSIGVLSLAFARKTATRYEPHEDTP